MTDWTTTIFILTWIVTAVYLGNGFGGISLKFLRARREPYMLSMSMALFGISVFELFVALILLISVLRAPAIARATPPTSAEAAALAQYIRVGFTLCLLFRAALCAPFFLQANDIIGDAFFQRLIVRFSGKKKTEE